jgi:hypothetical protein
MRQLDFLNRGYAVSDARAPARDGQRGRIVPVRVT